MGTEIQAKTNVSGSYSMRDLSDSAGGIWALYHEHKSLKNGQYYDSLLTSLATDGYLGYDKEQLRQTILKHDSIFRHQLAELHRLYRRQRDLMHEIKRRALHQDLIPAEPSQSSFFLSHIPSRDFKRTCHVSGLPFMDPTFARPLTSRTDSIQSTLSFMEGKNISSSFPSQDTVTSKDRVSPKSECNVLNLEVSADVYMNNKGKQLEESACGVSGMESCPPNRNCEVACEREMNLSLGSGLSSGCNGDAMRSNLCLRRTRDMVDLNEPTQVEEASVSASVDNLGDVTCLDEEIWRQTVPVNSKSGFHNLHKEFSQSSLIGSNGGILLNNMHSENEWNHTEHLPYKNEAGQRRCDSNSIHGGFYPGDSPAPFKSLQVEPSKADIPSSFFPSAESNKEPQRKRTIFGVEISEGNHDQSAVASQTPSLCPLVPQSDVSNSEFSFISPWSKPSSSLSQNVLSVQGNPCVSTSFPSNISSSSLMQSLEIVGGKMKFSSNMKSVSRAEVSYQHDICLGSQSNAKQLQVRCSPIGYDFWNGINGNNSVPEQFVPHGSTKYFVVSDCMDVKSAKDMNSGIGNPGSIDGQRKHDNPMGGGNPGSIDGQRKHDNPMGGLPWLKAKELFNVELTKGREDSCQMNSHSLQNYSQQFANKTEMGKGPSQNLVRESTSSVNSCGAVLEKIKAGVLPSNRKIPGSPIFGVPQISKDLTSLSSPSEVSCLASEVDGRNDGKDLDLDPQFGGQLEVDDCVTEKRLGNNICSLRHHIDLNLCMDEEETPPVPYLPRAIVKIATTEIDLEAPAVLESEMDLSPEVDSLENQLKSTSKLPLVESKEHNEELVKVAAEAIIAISLSKVHNLVEDITCNPLGVSSGDSLHWLAELVSSCKGDLEGELRVVSRGTDDAYDEESVPDGMDYFEFMTLKLTETKVEECCNESLALQNQKYEETGATVLSKRPRRGQARRGRQRKDFQRDILPGLISLSRHEVTQDFHAIEELLKASGFTWQPSLSQRNTAKNGRGRRRLEGSAPSLTPTVVCPPPVQQPIYRELLLEERTLTGWGKRTRRLPRQRCATDNPAHALKY